MINMSFKVLTYCILGACLGLYGCNETSSPSELSATQKANLLSAQDQPSSYAGSQAYNNSLFTAENVNGNTGDLTFAKSLINVDGVLKDDALNFQLSYSSKGGSGIFHLPTGWSYNISYVIPGKSVNIDGASYVYDPNWVDDTQYKSGLKYMNNHGVNFTIVPMTPIPSNSDKKRYYSYLYSGANGSHEYFDATGKELAKIDRFDNCISYYYADHGGVNLSFLDYIQDSYGQVFKFHYDGNSVSITNNNKTISSFTYNATGVSSISDAYYTTNYKYSDSKLINQIEYPSGLTTQIEYIKLPAIACASNQNITLNAVSNLSHLETGKLLNKTLYTYGSDTNGNNFTGYKTGFCIGGDTDNVVDSNNFDFQYDVLITKVGLNGSPDQKSRVYYNFLHLPVEQDDLDKSESTHFQTLYTYDISPKKHLRKASFAQPIQIVRKNQHQMISEVDATYDTYNQPLSTISSIISNGKLIKFRSGKTVYFPESSSAWYIPQTTLDTDEVNHTTIRMENTLAKNFIAIESTTKYYNNSPWDVNSFTYDNSGRLLTSNRNWVATGSHEGIGSTNLSYSYAYANNRLTITTSDALNHASTKIINTLLPGSPVVSEISSMKKTTTHVYDDLGREIKITSPLGESTTTAYYVMASDQRNQTVKTNPQSYTITTDYNPLGQTVDIKDNGGAN
ncbi:MAG: hypothetical protein K2P99_03520, partial [Burkholderiales bacterium]|nr:hypothetical protein [Burkholderiales bacterium]